MCLWRTTVVSSHGDCEGKLRYFCSEDCQGVLYGFTVKIEKSFWCLSSEDSGGETQCFSYERVSGVPPGKASRRTNEPLADCYCLLLLFLKLDSQPRLVLLYYPLKLSNIHPFRFSKSCLIVGCCAIHRFLWWINSFFEGKEMGN